MEQVKTEKFFFPSCTSLYPCGYGCERWTTKKAECQKLIFLNCRVGEDF